MSGDSLQVSPRHPTLRELGDDLTRLSTFRRWCSAISPFVWCAGYWAFAAHGFWIPAVFCLVALSFVTYGSVSHDLVHRNLGLPRRINDLLLVVIELLALRSGTAYRLAHLHHHRRYPAADDVEGAAAKMTLLGVLLEGVRFQFKIFGWAWRNHPTHRPRLALEGGLILGAYLASIAVLSWSVVPFAYAALLTVGAWIIPLVTSYIPHDQALQDGLHLAEGCHSKPLQDGLHFGRGRGNRSKTMGQFDFAVLSRIEGNVHQYCEYT